MRLWSIHPRYLDRQGLVACWREALLARKVLEGGTRGYRHHPQLLRFRRSGNPVGAINAYLLALWKEACRRGYRFDRGKIGAPVSRSRIPVTRGQLVFELDRLKSKSVVRSPSHHAVLASLARIEPHPLFRAVRGDVEPWERP